ncbi:MAG: prenyltransferase/squalene oxidase repeat-containing protein [Planctomycetota bacterium]
MNTIGLFALLAASSFGSQESVTVPVEGKAAPSPTDEEIQAVVQRAAEFLLGSQETYESDPPVGGLPDDKLAGWQAKEKSRLDALRGQPDAQEWPYEGVYRVGRDGHIPSGYRVGGSSIVAEALMGAGLDGESKGKAREAVQRTLSYVMGALDSDAELARGPKKGYDVRGWGHAYAVQLMLVALDEGLLEEDAEAEARDLVDDLIDRLYANQTSQGGWNYARDNSVSPFMTGSTLLILFDAKGHGFEVDGAVVEKALDGLDASSTEAMSYAYAGKARKAVAMPGSSARSSVATLALYKAGRRSLDDLRLAIQGFFDGYEDLLVRKSQQGTHVGEYGIAPYYFFFGHTYVARAIEELPRKEREARRKELVALLWSTLEEDGTWNDRIFPRTASYSTAMSMLALRAPKRGPVPGWEQ